MDPELRYEIIIYWSSDDQAFVAEAPELSCTADGWSYEAALLNLKIAIADLMDMAQKAGVSLPEPRIRQRSAY
jgi:predicted RNase H-like HicB family nuclease